MSQMYYYIAITHNFGDLIIRAANKREAEEILKINGISFKKVVSLKQYADEKIGVGGQGIVY